MKTREERRKELMRRVLGYTITVCAVLGITVVLFFVMIGYRLNFKSGTIQQGGLVQFISQPTGARITVGVAELARPTKSKITLNPGEYMVKMELDGYHAWQKLVTVEAGKVLWLNSARFVPKERSTEDVLKLATIDDTLVRQNGKFMAILPDEAKNKLVVAPLTESAQVKSDDIEFSLKAKKKQIFKLLEWSTDDRHLLLSRSYGSQQDIALVDIDNPDDTIVVEAISRKITPVEATFDPRSTRNLVVRYSDGSVRLVDGGSGKVSEPVLSNIDSMMMSQRSIVYSTTPVNKSVRTGYYTLDNGENHQLGVYTTKQPVRVALRKYYSDYYVATTVGKQLIIQSTTSLPADPASSPNLVSLQKATVASVPLKIGFQNGGRLIAVEGQKAVTVYDLELGELATTELIGRSKSPRSEVLAWLDGQHFWDDASGQLRQYEYDGTNQVDIVEVSKGYSAAYTSGGKYLYSIAKDGKRFVLQRTQMILP